MEASPVPQHVHDEALTKSVALYANEPSQNSGTVQHRCPLLDLPPELRNMIWLLVVVREDKTCEIKPGPNNTSSAAWAPPNISRVCSQLRSETLPMFFGQHAFRFSISGFAPYLPVLNNALVYLRSSHPKVRLNNFELHMKTHYPVAMQHLVQYVRIVGVHAARLPSGEFPIECLTATRDAQSVIMTERRSGLKIFLSDLTELGRRLGATEESCDYTTYALAICGFLNEHGPDHFRRFIIMCCIRGYRSAIRMRPSGQHIPYITHLEDDGEEFEYLDDGDTDSLTTVLVE